MTYDGKDGREEEKVVGEYWREVVALAPAWWHAAGGEEMV